MLRSGQRTGARVMRGGGGRRWELDSLYNIHRQEAISLSVLAASGCERMASAICRALAMHKWDPPTHLPRRGRTGAQPPSRTPPGCTETSACIQANKKRFGRTRACTRAVLAHIWFQEQLNLAQQLQWVRGPVQHVEETGGMWWGVKSPDAGGGSWVR